MLVRKGVRTGVSIALAGVTGGLSLGLDALFNLGDIANIQDVIDIADAASMVSDAMDAFDAVDVMDAFDAHDILDADLLNFNVADMDDINILDVGEGDNLLDDSYNVSFGYRGENHDNATVEFIKDLKNQNIDLPPNVDHNGMYFDHSCDGGLTSVDKSIIKVRINRAFEAGTIKEDIKDRLLGELARC